MMLSVSEPVKPVAKPSKASLLKAGFPQGRVSSLRQDIANLKYIRNVSAQRVPAQRAPARCPLRICLLEQFEQTAGQYPNLGYGRYSE